jgi:hypothetical protein
MSRVIDSRQSVMEPEISMIALMTFVTILAELLSLNPKIHDDAINTIAAIGSIAACIQGHESATHVCSILRLPIPTHATDPSE